MSNLLTASTRPVFEAPSRSNDEAGGLKRMDTIQMTDPEHPLARKVGEIAKVNDDGTLTAKFRDESVTAGPEAFTKI